MAEPQDNAPPGYVSPWGPQWGPQRGPWAPIPTPPAPTPVYARSLGYTEPPKPQATPWAILLGWN